MSGQERKCKPLPAGTDVIIRRMNGEVIQGKTAGPPIPHLLPFGQFYVIVKMPDGEEPFWRGTGRKSKERLLWEARRSEIGMYEREQMTLIQSV